MRKRYGSWLQSREAKTVNIRWNPVRMCVVAGCLLAATVGAQQIQVNKDNRTLAITASGAATGIADTATVHVGFLIYGPDAQAAYASGSKASNSIARAVAAAGVAKSDFQSESQNLTETPQFELEKLSPAEQAGKRFQLRQSWTARTAADNAAKVLQAAIDAGANQSGQIDWSIRNEDALEAEAAGNALVRARRVAAQMAQGLGIKLGDLIYASNQAAEPRPVLLRGMAISAEKAAPAPLAINPREIERTTTVYAVFSIQ